MFAFLDNWDTFEKTLLAIAMSVILIVVLLWFFSSFWDEGGVGVAVMVILVALSAGLLIPKVRQGDREVSHQIEQIRTALEQYDWKVLEAESYFARVEIDGCIAKLNLSIKNDGEYFFTIGVEEPARSVQKTYDAVVELCSSQSG